MYFDALLLGTYTLRIIISSWNIDRISFSFSPKTFFIIYCKASLLTINSVNFCWSETVFISTELLKDNFSGYRILGWWFFLPSQYFNISLQCSCLQFLTISLKWFFSPLYVRFRDFPPSLSSFRMFFFIFDFLYFENNVVRYSFSGIYPAWCSWSFLDVCFDVTH